MNRVVYDRRFWLLPIVVWTALVGASYVWNEREVEQHAQELAVNRGRFVFKMVDSVRLWNARHGGVYAPVSEQSPPNPHLEVPERDITTPSGTALTLVNPAYMTRQVASVVLELSGIAMRLTSLDPLNPDNAADDWETAALEAFERNRAAEGIEGERAGFVTEGESRRFRYIAPLITKQACLKCHEKQGYRVGDVRGALSVSFPADALLAGTEHQSAENAATHAVVWLLVTGLTLAALALNRRQLLSLRAAKAEQDALVALRTRELREEVAEREQAETRLRSLLESSGEGIYGVDSNGRCTFCNPKALELLGLDSPGAILGRTVHELTHGCGEETGDACPLVRSYRGGEPVHADEATFCRADGSTFAVEYRSTPLYENGRRVGAVVTFADTTVRRAHDAELRKLSAALRYSPESVVITDRDGNIEYVNEHFSRVTGYAAAEVVGQNPRLLQSGHTPDATYEEMWETILAGRVWQGELQNRKKTGELYWEEVSIAPIQDTRGAITHFVAVKEDITERRQLREQIWRQANYDQLTGLVNRNLFHDRLEQMIAQARREQGSFALVYIDLDRFKEVNDALGHTAGDELLRQAAKRIGDCLRQADTAARMGGDEFTLLLPQVGHEFGVTRVADKVLTSLSIPFALGAAQASISASIGVALYPKDGTDSETLLRHADEAMYRAKAHGRARVRRYSDGADTAEET